MIKEFVDAWNANKDNLENYFRATIQDEYSTYCNILKATIEKVINLYLSENARFPMSEGLTLSNVTEIDDGEYQGTLIFLIPFNTYQPDIEDYIVFSVYYGSCSVCDTLQSIQAMSRTDYWDSLPIEEQVKDYMRLALHMVQNAFYLKEKNN